MNAHQYSSGSKMVVADLSASVITHVLTPLSNVYALMIRKPSATESSFSRQFSGGCRRSSLTGGGVIACRLFDLLVVESQRPIDRIDFAVVVSCRHYIVTQHEDFIL
jgi:hypothetical protein